MGEEVVLGGFAQVGLTFLLKESEVKQLLRFVCQSNTSIIPNEPCVQTDLKSWTGRTEGEKSWEQKEREESSVYVLMVHTRLPHTGQYSAVLHS